MRYYSWTMKLTDIGRFLKVVVSFQSGTIDLNDVLFKPTVSLEVKVRLFSQPSHSGFAMTMHVRGRGIMSAPSHNILPLEAEVEGSSLPDPGWSLNWLKAS